MVSNAFRHFAMSVRIKFTCLKRLMIWYAFVLAVGIIDVVNDFDVVLAAIAALEVRMFVSFSVRNKFICSDGVMFVTYLCLLLLSVLNTFEVV